MLAHMCAALVVLVTPTAPSGGQAGKAAHATGRAAARRPAERVPANSATPFQRAKAQLDAVKRDPTKRKFRHHWERAIRALAAAARGKDAPAALLEAARGRYALYRFSSVEADREEALRLAGRARKAGSREAAAFALAVRREAGDASEPPRRPKASAARETTVVPAQPPPPALEPGAKPGEEADETERRDPVLERALGAVLAGAAAVPPAPEATAGTAPARDVAESRPAQEEGAARVSEVRSWSNSDYTRVAVYLSRPTGHATRDLPADATHPRRLALDLRPAVLETRGLPQLVGDALVTRVRAAQFDPETVRVVLELTGQQDLQIFSLDDPPRLIVDVGVREARRESIASGPSRPSSARGPSPAGELDPHRPIRRIILDAGHGGHDAGAIGPRRVREKDVTLAMARKLARKLRAAGFHVSMTRDGDRYVPLEERTAFANMQRGDLFVSLHANAHPRRDRGGVETYVLDVAHSRYAARLAARENGALSDDGGEGQDVRRILSDLDAKSSVEPSRRLARIVQRELTAGVRSRVGDVRDLGVKSALFYVLLGARMPAVLVETSFISNRVEEKRLASPRFQEEVATSVARAVRIFADREARLAVASRSSAPGVQ